MTPEGKFKKALREELEVTYPGCIILKNDAALRQGIPDMLILVDDRWAMLEAKESPAADIQPNQPWYVDLANEMSFGAFIYPENKDDVLRQLAPHFARR